MYMSENGSDFLIMRLTAVLLVSSLLLGAAVSFAGNEVLSHNAGDARSCAFTVAEAARLEYVMGSPGEGGTVIETDVPQSVRCIVYGGSPGEWPGKDRTECAYYIEFTDGRIETYVTDVRFSFGDSTGDALDRPVAIYPGNNRLTLKLSIVNESTTLAIFGGSKC